MRRARGRVRSRGLRWRRAGGDGAVGRRLLSACGIRSAPEGWVGGRGAWALWLVYGAAAGGAGLCRGVKGRWGALPGALCEWGAVKTCRGGTVGAWVGCRAHWGRATDRQRAVRSRTARAGRTAHAGGGGVRGGPGGSGVPTQGSEVPSQGPVVPPKGLLCTRQGLGWGQGGRRCTEGRRITHAT